MATDKVFLEWARKRRRKDGSTAVTAVLVGGMLHLGWVGDSRAVLVDERGQPSWVSADHKPNRPDEEARIKAAGGVVICQTSGTAKCWRVSTQAGLDYAERRRKGRLEPGEKVSLSPLAEPYRPCAVLETSHAVPQPQRRRTSSR